MPRTPQRPDEYSATHACDAAVIADARSELHAWLRPRVDADELIDDVIVVLSELMANACAASDPAADSISVRARIGGDVLVLEVANLASQRAMVEAPPDLTDPLRGHGRGLVIAKALMDAVEVDLRDGWTILRCTTKTLVAPT